MARSQRKSPPLPQLFPWRWAAALFLLTVLTYIPSMTNGFIWDDPAYVIDNPTLKSDKAAQGLWRIWTDPTATPQYYPMVHSTFWIEARLWGTDQATGYHIDNILLHALAAVLLWRALVALQVPWPWFAAAIFAVHPVMVESVAWVTERKNALSIVFYLLAFHAYHRCGFLNEKPIDWEWYAASLVCSVLALLSKTVTCSLPAAILLIIWWKRGRITRGDVIPLLPMFVWGLLLGWMTSHLEGTRVGARGPDFQWSIVDRCLIAGHAICFYATKLLWPHPLIFMYPRWDLHTDRGLQFIFPAVVVLIVMSLWFARHRLGRGPLVAVLFFIGTLVPALGFVNVYPMRYSFVADHFQYLASIGVIVLITAALCRIKQSVPPRVVMIVVLTPLVGLTIWQQLIYRDAESLWKNTIQQNDNCWMAHLNLAAVYKQEGKMELALKENARALELGPNEADTQWNMGNAMAIQLRWREAAQYFRAAIACDAERPQPWSDLSRVLWDHGEGPKDKSDAVTAANTAIDLDPNQGAPHYVLGGYQQLLGDPRKAIAEYRLALEIEPLNFLAQLQLGNCLMQIDDPEHAAGEYHKVLIQDPNNVPAWTGLGNAALKAGYRAMAIDAYQHALLINPNYMPARDGLGRAQRK